MEEGGSVYCYLYMDGELKKLPNGDVAYIGGRRAGILLNKSTNFHDFASRVASKLELDSTQLSFSYTLHYDPFEMLPLKNDDDLHDMLHYTEGCGRVYAFKHSTEFYQDLDVCPQYVADNIHPVSDDRNGGLGTVDSRASINQMGDHLRPIAIQSIGFSGRISGSQTEQSNTCRFANAIIGSSHTFPSADAFRDALYLMSLGGRFNYRFKRNCPQHITAICAIKNCPWKITARPVGHTSVFQVFTFHNIHTHTPEEASYRKPFVKSTRASQVIDEVIKASLEYLPRQLCKDFRRDYGMDISYYQAWQYKERAKERIHGLPQNLYMHLPWLCSRLIEQNPGTIAECKYSEDGHFLMLFVALAVSIEGFLSGCRPILAIDSSYMSGPYRGALFSASAYDANDGLFPLAYGIFSSENYDDWLWFLQHLKLVVKNREVVIISDRHPSLLKSVAEVFGRENHSRCYRHVKENFSQFLSKKKTLGRRGKGNALEMLDAIAYARLDCEYESALGTLQLFNPELSKWVEDNHPEHWAMSKFSKMRWGKMNSNLAESFNSWLRFERHHNIDIFFHEYIDKLGQLLVDHKT